MNKSIIKYLRKLAFGALLVMSCYAVTGCDDTIEEENRFTFTGELIADHLKNKPEKFSTFCNILEKAKIGKKTSGNLLNTLSTYGSYTCFAPTNEAFEIYIEEKYKQYLEDGIDKGITSLDINEISDSMATEIAMNHLIEMGYQTIQITEGGIFPQVTMSRRDVPLKYVNREDGSYAMVVSTKSTIIEHDVKTENGYIQVVDRVIDPSNDPLPEQIKKYSELSLFAEAVYETGFDKILRTYEIDPDYDGHLIHDQTIGNEGPAPYPEERHQRYTVLVETNDIFAKHNITTLEELEAFAASFYGEEARGDYKNPENALYKFVAYHIIDRKLVYSSGTGCGGFIMENYVGKGFNSEVNLTTSFDRYDYFETMLPHTMIKVTKPYTNTNGLSTNIVINYAQEGGTYLMPGSKMGPHINVVVQKDTDSGIKDFDYNALNGTIHTLNKILIYNEEEMRGNILNERMRWDCSSLFPELTNNGVRWASNIEHNITYIPSDFCERLIVNSDDAHVFYLRPHRTGLADYSSYMGDELLVKGRYDFQYRIPYVPEGDYEIRFGFSLSSGRGVCQLYFDNKICGIPIDMRTGDDNEKFIGWFDDAEYSEEEILENDKALRNRGFMKGPASCMMTDKNESMRASKNSFRKILGKYRLTKGDHWLRIKNVTEGSNGSDFFNQDYLEIVPLSVINNARKPEDQN